MPVLALGAGYIPAFGGISNPTAALGMQQLAENVTGIIVPNSGHFIAEEQPQFVIDQLSRFFGNSTNTTTAATTAITPPASSPNSTTGNTTALDDRTAALRNLLGQ
jgi:hypothetical protein